MDTNYLTNLTDKKGNTLEIEMRPDGYFNASKMCKSTGKQWVKYFDNQRTREFLEELSENLKIPATPSDANGLALVYSKKGGSSPGTWVERKVWLFAPQ